jgi:hypothetical protein
MSDVQKQRMRGALPVQSACRSNQPETGDPDHPRCVRVHMPRLYRSPNEPQHWLVWSEELGWSRFPAKVDGWTERQSTNVIARWNLQRVPLQLAFNTGLLESVQSLQPRAFERAA